MLRIKYTGDFEENLRCYKGNLEILRLIDKRIKIFRKNPNDSRLRNHALTKKMKGKFAFSITDNIRIVYEWLGKSTIRFLAIGTHNKVYKKV